MMLSTMGILEDVPVLDTNLKREFRSACLDIDKFTVVKPVEGLGEEKGHRLSSGHHESLAYSRQRSWEFTCEVYPSTYDYVNRPSPSSISHHRGYVGPTGNVPRIRAFDAFNTQFGDLRYFQRTSSRVRGRFSGLSTLGGSIRRFSDFRKLFTHISGLRTHCPPLEEGKNGNSDGGDGGTDSTGSEPPFGRRVIFLWSTGGLLFPGCYFGSKLIDSGRNKIGIALIVGCYGLFAWGLALIVLSGFSWSWGWWL